MALRAGALTGLMNQSTAQVIDGSLKFDNDKTQYLTRTPGTAGNRNVWTWSGWVKKSNATEQLAMFSAGSSGGTNNATYGFLWFQNNGVLYFHNWDGQNNSAQTNATFRDTGWYHVVAQHDESASSKMRFYVNGIEQSLAYNLTTSTAINSTETHYIGVEPYSGGRKYYDGSMTQVYLIDGLALGPGYFGFTDPLTGTWRPKKFRAEGTTVNDGRVFSSTGTFSNWDTGSYPKTELFDGTVYTGGTPNGASTSGASDVASFDFGDQQITGFQNLQINIFISSNQASATNLVSVNGIDITQECHAAGNNTWTTVDLGSKFTTLKSFSIANYYIYVGGFIVDGVIMQDSTTTNLDFGTNGFYLPMDGNSPIGEDKSGNGNNWTPVNFGGSVELDKATGALPILNTTPGGTQASVGVRTDAYASSLVLALPLVGSKDDVSNQINSGSSTKAITNGGATASSANSNFYGGSFYFNNNISQYLSASSTDFNFGSNPFTVEFWFKHNETSSWNSVYFTQGAVASGVSLYQSGANIFVRWGGNPAYGYFAFTPSNDKWYHFALVREGTGSGETKVYIDGISQTTWVIGPPTMTSISSNDIYIGKFTDNTGYENYGYMQDFRVYKGVAKYTSNFIPASTSPDILPDTPSGVSGGSKLAKVIDGAVAFDNSGDSLTVPDHADFDLGTNSFTIECFAYLQTIGQFNNIFAVGTDSSNGYRLDISTSNNLRLLAQIGGSWSTVITGGTALASNKWYHLVVTRSGNNFDLWVDGIKDTTTVSNSGTITNPTTQLEIGRLTTNSLNRNFHGFISNLRFVNGTALYTANFTPPSAPLTNVTNTKLLCCKSNTFAGNVDVSPSGILKQYEYGSVASAGNYNSTTPAAAFDSSGTSTAYYFNAGTWSLDWTYFGGVTVSSSLRIYCYPRTGTLTVNINGSNVASITGNSEAWRTVTFTGTINTITFTANDVYGGVSAIEVDGSNLVSQVVGNAAATNFNPFTTDINAVRGQESGYTTWNPLDIQGLDAGNLKDGNLSITHPAGDWLAVRANKFVSSGKWYYEVKVGNNQYTTFGVGSVDYKMTPTANDWCNVANVYGFYPYNGKVYDAATGRTYATADTSAAGNVYGIAIDMDNKSLRFYENGRDLGVAFDSTTATNFVNKESVAPMAWLYNQSGTDEYNFGQKPFKFPPPDGFQPLNAANVRPETVISRPDKYVGATTYTSDGTAQNLDFGFKPDFVWFSRRNVTGAIKYLVDSVRGIDKVLSTSHIQGTEAENALTGGGDYDQVITSLNPTGITIGTSTQSNENTGTYVTWAWKAGGNKNTFNVDDVGYATASAAGLDGGTITPTGASVGTKQGFSIIGYTGTDNTSDTFSHGLSQKPDFAIFKNRSQSGDDWIVYHSSQGATKRGKLNLTNAFDAQTSQFNDTEPTSSLFTIGTFDNINKLNNNYISYIWHDVPGLQKFGRYQGTGNADGPFIELGFRPSVIMLKNDTNAGNNWWIIDSERSTYNGQYAALFPNTNGAENNTSAVAVDFLSNGFKCRGTDGGQNPGSGNSFVVYAAWAEAPSFNLYGGQSNAR